MNGVIRESIGTGIELLIEGLPQSLITPAVQAKAVMSLVRFGIPVGAAFTQGVIGGVSTAALQIGSQIYRLKFSFIALRAITALEVYSEAIEWIEFKKARGTVDGILADDTIDYLREDLRRRQRSWLR